MCASGSARNSAPERRDLRTALFGGSFDPVHLGHVAIAAAAVAECALDRVIFLPCQQSPHKARRLAPGVDRVAMLELALRGMEEAEVSSWELGNDGPSYSWRTAEHFAREIGAGGALYWILGADQWAVLDSWAKPEVLAELLTFIVFPRGGEAGAPGRRFRHRRLEANHPASSTEARRRLAAGEPTGGILAPEVARYAEARGLYARGA